MYVLVAMYLLISSVALTSITPQELSTTYQEDPIAGVVSGLSWGKQFLGPWLGILAALLLFVAANAGLIGASRLSFNLGEYYQLPRFFYKLHPKFQTPYNALVIFAVLSITIVIASRGELSFLADLYNFGAMLAFTSAHVSLLTLRYKHPDMPRPFKVPFNIPFRGRSYPISAIIGAISTISVFCLVVFTKPEGRNLGFTWMIVGTTIYLFYRRGQKLRASGSLRVEKIKPPHFKPLAIKKIFVPVIDNSCADQIIDIAIDTALLHGSKIICVDFEDIPYTAPIQTQLVDFTNQKLRSWKAVSESKGVDFELYTYRSHHVYEDALILTKKSGSDLVITSDIDKELIKKLRKKAKVSVWVCY
jgi:APA family basic amino acid/polyamine antiporter